MNDYYKKYSNIEDIIIDNYYDFYKIKDKIDGNIKNEIDITMNDVLNIFTDEELIEAIGLDKVEIILRKKKLEKIKLDIK